MQNSTRRTLLITGIAEGLATEIARAGYDVLGLLRGDRASSAVGAAVEQRGGQCTHLACDITRAADVALVPSPKSSKVR
jgi:NAD(P)-dependent dehydrogenase (short-subunit alcohol dehydrogenase family)